MHVIRRCRSQVLGVVRRYYVGVVRRYAPPFSTLRIRSIGRPFQNLSDAGTCLPRTPVRASVDARSCICRTPVPVSVRTGVGWKLYYDAYHTFTNNPTASLMCQEMSMSHVNIVELHICSML